MSFPRNPGGFGSGAYHHQQQQLQQQQLLQQQQQQQRTPSGYDYATVVERIVGAKLVAFEDRLGLKFESLQDQMGKPPNGELSETLKRLEQKIDNLYKGVCPETLNRISSKLDYLTHTMDDVLEHVRSSKPVDTSGVEIITSSSPVKIVPPPPTPIIQDCPMITPISVVPPTPKPINIKLLPSKILQARAEERNRTPEPSSKDLKLEPHQEGGSNELSKDSPNDSEATLKLIRSVGEKLTKTMEPLAKDSEATMNLIRSMDEKVTKSLEPVARDSEAALNLVRAMDAKFVQTQEKLELIESKFEKLQNKIEKSNSALTPGSNSAAVETPNSNDLKEFLTEQLKPVKSVSDKLDNLIKHDKDVCSKILDNLESMDKTLQDVYDKASDAKSRGKESAKKSEEIVTKVNKVQEYLSALPSKTFFYQLEEILKKSNETPRRSLSKGRTVKSRHSSSGKRHSISDNEDSDQGRRSRSLSVEITAPSAERRSKKHKKQNAKKRHRSKSSSDSEEEDQAVEGVNEKLMLSFAKNLSKVLGSVEDIERRMESWMKSSKKSVKTSDEATNCLLQQMIQNNKALEKLIHQQSSLESQVSEISQASPEQDKSAPLILEVIQSINERVAKFFVVVQELKDDQSGHFKNLSTDIMEIHDRTLKLGKLDKLDKVDRLDDVNAKLKTIYKMLAAHDIVTAKMVKDIEQTLVHLQHNSPNAGDSKTSSKETMVLMRELIPKMDDVYIKVLPLLEDLKKLQRQAADQDELQEKQNSVNLQKILSHLEDIATKSTKPSDPRILSTDTSMLQMYTVITDLKSQLSHRDQQTHNGLAELKSESVKATNRLNEILKTKATEKMLGKISSSIDEMKQNSVNDMKTLSTMNTMLQGIRTSNSSNDAKFAMLLKEVKQLLVDTTTPIKDIGKGIEAIQKLQSEVERRSAQFPSIEDLKNLDATLRNQLGLIPSSVYDKLQEMPLAIRVGTGTPSKKDQDVVDQKVFAQISDIGKEMEKISGISAEILNSVEDLKQLTSTVPNTVHDLVPKIEKLSADVTELPNEVGAYTAALEENLGKNVENFIKTMYQTVLQEILGKFDLMEQRMAVIKRYAKYGNAKQPESTPTNQPRAIDVEVAPSEGSSTQDASEVVPVVPAVVTPSGMPVEELAQTIVKHISNECRILGDSIANTIDQFIATADTTEVRQSIDTLDDKLEGLLSELKSLDQQILSEQAKGTIVEEQMEALANTILQPIQEIKPLQDQIAGSIETKLKNLLAVQRRPNQLKAEQFEKLAGVQQDCLSLLMELKRFFSFASDDRLGDLMAGNVDEAVKALARNRLEERSVYQAEAVKNLIDYLRRVQATQHDILRNSDRSIEYQASLNDALFKVVPVLELIHKVLKERKKLKLDSGPVLDLCNQLGEKINVLAELEQKLISDKRDRYTDDFGELLQMCKNVMEQLNVDPIDSKMEEISPNNSPIPEPIISDVTDLQMTELTSMKCMPESPQSRTNWGPKRKRSKPVVEKEDATDPKLKKDFISPSLDQTPVAPLREQDGDTTRIEPTVFVSQPPTVEPNGSTTTAAASDSTQVEEESKKVSDETSDEIRDKTDPAQLTSDTNDSHSLEVEVINTNDDDDATPPANEDESSILKVDASADRKAVVVKLVSDDAKQQRTSQSDKCSKDVDHSDKPVKDDSSISHHVPEEEARKRKYQPKVVVEDINKKRTTDKCQARDSSTDSVKSSDSKKLKK